MWYLEQTAIVFSGGASQHGHQSDNVRTAYVSPGGTIDMSSQRNLELLPPSLGIQKK